MKTKEIIRRYIVFIIGLFFISMGIAFIKHGELGITPVSCVPNILSYKFTFFTMGQWLITANILYISLQILILRSNFKLYQLMQLPLSFAFGIFTDLCLKYITKITADTYIMQLVMVIIGLFVISFGISLTVIANVIMNSAEALVKAISDTAKTNFGNVKIIFDITCVLLSILLSMIFFDCKIMGVREGTIITAIFTGFIVKFFIKILSPVDKYLKG